MFARNAELPLRRLMDTAPGPEPEWIRLARANNTRIVVTAGELAALNDALEELMAPYVVREPDCRPPKGREVRLLMYTLPECPGSADVATGTGTGTDTGIPE
ncbi:hypothetical protein [Streptomyces sp. NPDC050528]|uniref:hypothetical protein n=1 Tax=Streptomyces sp. NPDC050528 TaxID=3365623 RepID=UPI00378C1808